MARTQGSQECHWGLCCPLVLYSVPGGHQTVGETCHILANMWNVLRVCRFIYKQLWFKIALPEQNSLDSYSLLSSCSEAVDKLNSKRNFHFTEVLYFTWFLHNWGVNYMSIPSWVVFDLNRLYHYTFFLVIKPTLCYILIPTSLVICLAGSMVGISEAFHLTVLEGRNICCVCSAANREFVVWITKLLPSQSPCSVAYGT